MCLAALQDTSLIHLIQVCALQEAATGRGHNRWGDGLESPAGGSKDFFEKGWVPTLKIHECLSVFPGFKEEAEEIFQQGEELKRFLDSIDVKMTAHHAAVIYAYTMESPALYIKLNMACRSSAPFWGKALKKFQNYLYYLENAINALPNFTGPQPVFRGIKDSMSEVEYTIGSTITWQQLSSASKSASVATRFLQSGSKRLAGTLFIIRVSMVKELEHCSNFPEEVEVLFPLNSHFKVLSSFTTDKDKVEHASSLRNFDVSDLVVFELEQLG